MKKIKKAMSTAKGYLTPKMETATKPMVTSTIKTMRTPVGAKPMKKSVKKITKTMSSIKK